MNKYDSIAIKTVWTILGLTALVAVLLICGVLTSPWWLLAPLALPIVLLFGGFAIIAALFLLLLATCLVCLIILIPIVFIVSALMDTVNPERKKDDEPENPEETEEPEESVDTFHIEH